MLLASASPRRRELLHSAGVRFEVVAPDVNESEARHLTTRELTRCNAVRKALAVARTIKDDAVVLAADTLVALAGEPIGKPRDFHEARKILRRLSGREHEVCTAVCLVRQHCLHAFEVVSRVRFHRLSEQVISAYLAKIDPLDKAGAYAAQGHGREVIQRIRGSFTNVVGLPMEETLAALAEFRIKPAASGGKSPAYSRPDPRRKRRSNPEYNRHTTPVPRARVRLRA